MWGSFNWLSYGGQGDGGYRRETSAYSERPADVALWKANAATLFGGGRAADGRATGWEDARNGWGRAVRALSCRSGGLCGEADRR